MANGRSRSTASGIGYPEGQGETCVDFLTVIADAKSIEKRFAEHIAEEIASPEGKAPLANGKL